ncbi:hypothetical protein GPECTOR_76g792 [Gonium pectorale]|uniref:Helicase ATP-binding domain-containing protein n=1 Tax=Gonium pectorale TaxID=33097 RepID=A0A150G2D2_GONPE|nr:hypothetical protein GPECTOR_76g792 [Gonium pectorale]|eukprot:KXZ43971.1 hypothetical protein GPECTOR_76g792 [Gonium pectorale]
MKRSAGVAVLRQQNTQRFIETSSDEADDECGDAGAAAGVSGGRDAEAAEAEEVSEEAPPSPSSSEDDNDDDDDDNEMGAEGDENKPPRKAAAAAPQPSGRGAQARGRGRGGRGGRGASGGGGAAAARTPAGAAAGGCAPGLSGVKRPGSSLGMNRRLGMAAGGGVGGSYGAASKPYKCPIPNYRGQLGQRGTLGPRRLPVAALQNLFRQLRTIVPAEAAKAAAPGNDGGAPAEPLCLFDPATEPEDSPRRGFSAIWVEAWLARQLRAHQREGVRFMVHCITGLRQEGLSGCILCDGMGLGKTFQSIATLWTLLTTGVAGGRPTCSKPLILCPASLVANWGAELTRWLEGRVAPVVVDDTRGDKVKESLSSFGGYAAVRAGKPQVLVMGYTTFRMHRDAVARKGIDIVVCDEAHTLKNGESQLTQSVASLPAKMRLLLSGTPIQNDLTEFYTLFNVAVPGLLGEPASFRRTFESPILRGQDADATDAEVALGAERSGRLLELCGRFMLRRTCGLMKQYLPPKVEQVVFCRMSPLQARLYEFFLNSPPVVRALQGRAAARDKAFAVAARRAAKDEGGGGGGGRKGKAKGKGGKAAAPTDGENCEDGEGVGGGGVEGTAAWGEEGPGCAAAAAGGPGGGKAAGQVDLSVLAAITTVKKMCCHPDLVAVLEMMLKAVQDSGSGDKVVLVSNYTEALDVLGVMCRAHNWVALRLDGSCSVKARQPIVDTFNDPAHPSFVLLLSSKAGGVGLNIIGANRLVLFDPGAGVCACVYQRQLAKQGLSAAIVDDTAAQSRTFSQEELRALFEVNTTTMCDTHGAIKCRCDGSSATAKSKQQAAKAAAAAAKEAPATAAAAAAAAEEATEADGAGAGGGAAGGSKPAKDEHEGGAIDDGIMQWAHLASVADSPDPIWNGMSTWLRDKFTTYLFSDHIINDTPQQLQIVPEEDEEEAEEAEEAEGREGEDGEGMACDDVGDYGVYAE